MNRRIFYFLLLLVVLLSGVSVVSAQGGTRQYIIMARGETSVSQPVKAQIAAAGGTVVRDLSSMGLLVVSSSNANFDHAIPGARAVMPDVKMQWLEPTKVYEQDV